MDKVTLDGSMPIEATHRGQIGTGSQFTSAQFTGGRQSLLARLRAGAISKLVMVLCAFSLISAPAHAKNTKYAAFIIHADSGDILFDRYSTQHRYPASLTKMMTLYLLFEEIEAGRLTLKSRLRVSKTAAGQPPSKLGVAKGSTIDVETAIKSLIVKSANDVAVVVAEKIGKTEWQFAKRMTQRARQLGMTKTSFRNASGLPNSRQLTTARDMAELSRRLFQDFPQYRHYFSTKSFVYKGRTYTTHNSLVKNYQGADGIKTGYTRRSGFNLSTSATRDGNHLIGIVLGGRSSYTRDKHMREILDTAFARMKSKPNLITALHRSTPTPRIKPSPYGNAPTLAGNTELQATLSGAAAQLSDQSFSSDPLGSLIASNGTVAQNGHQTGQPQVHTIAPRKHDQVATLISREDNSYGAGEGDIDNIAALTASITDAVTTNSQHLGTQQWAVQIGAYSTSQYAEKQLAIASNRAGLTERSRRVIPLSVNAKPTLYRARFFYAEKQDAQAGCKALRAQGFGCFVTNTASS